MKNLKNKPLLVVAFISGLMPLAASAAMTAKVNCDPAHDVKGEAKPNWKKPLTYELSSVPGGGGVRLAKKFGDGNTAIFQLVDIGGQIEVKGAVYSEEKKADGTSKYVNEFSPVKINSSSALPVTFESVYTWGRGKRNCSIVVADSQAKTLSAALGGGTAQRDPQTARNTSDIAVNRGAIAQNAGRIDANSGRIDRNEQGIASNRQAIGDSNSRIADNSRGIADNSRGIADNSRGIADNRSAIGRNVDAINSTNDRMTANRAEMKSRTTTINEGYGNKATGTGEEWAMYKSGVPFQQNQFCRLIGNFKEQFAKARAEKNQIKENIALREREQRLVALLPKGAFENWIVRAVSVKQASDGSAAVLFELPCDVVVGSYACGNTASQFLGTIAENSPMYNELAKVSVGDFLGVSGQFYFGAGSKAFEKNRSVASFRQMPAGSHCQGAAAGIQDGEFFAVTTVNISTLK